MDYAIIMLDPDGHIVSWNAGAERIKGYREEEILGRHFSCFYTEEDIRRGHPEHELRVAATEGRYEEEALARPQGRVAVLGQRRPHGHQGWIARPPRLLQGHSRPHRAARADRGAEGRTGAGDGGAGRGRGGRLAEAQVAAFAARLERSNRELQEFASVASHDLQEPLRKIQAFGDRLQAKYADGARRAGPGLPGADAGGGRADAELINDLLTFSRVTTKAAALRRRRPRRG